MSEGTHVPESDLLAVKARLAKETAEFQVKLDESIKKADAHYTTLLAEQTAKQTAVAELEELKKEVEQLKGSVPLREKAEAKVKELELLLLGVSLKRISEVYKIPAAKLQGKTIAELNSIEEALRLVGREPGRFDIAGTAIGAGEKLTAQEKIKLGFEQLSKR